MSKPTRTSALPIQRLAAFAVDWCVIAVYGLALFGVVVALNGGVPQVSAPYNPLLNQLVGFACLTLPVMVYFVASEYRGGATLGKRVLGIRTVSINSKNLTLRQASVRTALKFIPWEMAHFCTHQFVAANTENREAGAVTLAVLAVVYLLAGLYLAMLFLRKDHRTAYDLAADTQVVRA